ELRHWFLFGDRAIAVGIIAYGFVASVLPVWLLLCPRDYLSSFMKIGAVALLAVGVIVVNPRLSMPAVTEFARGGGPVFPGTLFPYVFITIACGAISGFHSLPNRRRSPGSAWPCRTCTCSRRRSASSSRAAPEARS